MKIDIKNNVDKKILYTLMGHMPIGSFYFASEYPSEQASGFIKKIGLTFERPVFGLLLVISPPFLRRSGWVFRLRNER